MDILARKADAALNDRYQYGLSSPGQNFGWLANVSSVTFAYKAIKAVRAGDLEMVADAVHRGWAKIAMDDYEGKLVLDTPTPDIKKEARKKLAMTAYADLSEEEKEKDRVIARVVIQEMAKTMA
jgi:hypothetical protein